MGTKNGEILEVDKSGPITLLVQVCVKYQSNMSYHKHDFIFQVKTCAIRSTLITNKVSELPSLLLRLGHYDSLMSKVEHRISLLVCSMS